VEDGKQEYKGTTLDGDPIYHVTYYDVKRKKHISYDTVEVDGSHHYIMGSGHERDHNSSSISKWDMGNRKTWQEALGSRTNDLIR
jgi:hypothetical protein